MLGIANFNVFLSVFSDVMSAETKHLHSNINILKEETAPSSPEHIFLQCYNQMSFRKFDFFFFFFSRSGDKLYLEKYEDRSDQD